MLTFLVMKIIKFEFCQISQKLFFNSVFESFNCLKKQKFILVVQALTLSEFFSHFLQILIKYSLHCKSQNSLNKTVKFACDLISTIQIFLFCSYKTTKFYRIYVVEIVLNQVNIKFDLVRLTNLPLIQLVLR